MIVVKLELHSALTGQIEEIGRMYICNDGKGTEDIGSYDVKIMRRGVTNQSGQIYRTGRVERHMRKKVTVWALVEKAIKACIGDFT